MAENPIYKVIFFSQGEIYEVFAKKVSHGGLFGFIEVENLVFGATTKLVVDPSQERLAKEFEGVHRTYIPIHAVLRIDEVEKEGTGRITSVPKDAEGKVRPFPTPIYTPRRDGETS